jgi:parallel beta-helix repeat protein/putative cofactor-binding repeat protein
MLAAAAICAVAAADDGSGPPPVLPLETWPVFDVTEFGAAGNGLQDDLPAIEAAIEAVAQSGFGIVYFPEGVYRIDGTVHMRSFTALQGEGPRSVIRASDDFPAIKFVGNAFQSIVLTAIRDLTIQGVGETPGDGHALIAMHAFVEHAWIERCVLRDSPHDGWFALRECRHLYVTDNVVVNCADDGLNPGGGGPGLGTRDVLVARNTVVGVANDGIHVSLKSHSITVKDNLIMDCNAGIGLAGTSLSTIRNNTITGCPRGIFTHPNFGATVKMNIHDNAIAGADEVGIRLDGFASVVQGNTVDGAAVGISVQGNGCAVRDNEVGPTQGRSLEITGGDGVEHVVVTGNQLAGSLEVDAIVVDAACSFVGWNTTGPSAGFAVRDLWGYTRVAQNDVQGPIDAVPGDIDCDAAVNTSDLLALLAAWGPYGDPIEDQRADIDASGAVDTADLLLLLANFES